MAEHHPTPQVAQSPMPAPRKSRQRFQKTPQTEVARLVEQYPLLFWGGIWITVLLVAAIAISGLLSPSLPNGRQASSAAFGTGVSPEVESARGGQVPVWVFGAIVLSCTAGSILVSKRLTRSGRVQRISRPHHQRKYATVVKPPRRTPKSHAPKRLKPFTEADFAPLEKLQPASTQVPVAPPPPPVQPVARLKPVRSPSRKSQHKTPPPVAVTVVPSEETHPLDWQDPGLAELMDIRKRRSLSSWM